MRQNVEDRRAEVLICCAGAISRSTKFFNKNKQKRLSHLAIKKNSNIHLHQLLKCKDYNNPIDNENIENKDTSQHVSMAIRFMCGQR